MIDSPMIPGAAGSIVEMGFGYFGIVGWSAALLLFKSGPRRRASELILAALIVFALGGAMGLPVFRSIIEALPGIRLAPPLRLLLLVSVAGSPLAALEVNRLFEEGSNAKSAAGFLAVMNLLLAALAVVVFFALRASHVAVGGLSSQSSALLQALALLFAAAMSALLFHHSRISGVSLLLLLTGLAATELLYQGARLYRFYSPADLYPETPLIRFLRSRPLPYRVAGDGGALFPNTNVFALVENIGTHDPSERRDYVQFLDRAAGYPPFEYFKTIHDLNSRTLDFLNARYLVATAGRQAPSPKWTLEYDGPDGRVFENRNVLPRVFAPPRIRWIPLNARAQPANNAVLAFGKPLDELLASGAFSEQAVVLSSPDLSRGLPPDGSNRAARIGVLTETTNRVRFDASVSGGPAILVSSFTTDGGWSAQDESGSKLRTGYANGPFLAIRLSPGYHVITLTYVPPGFRSGAAISVATALILIALLGLPTARRRAARA